MKVLGISYMGGFAITMNTKEVAAIIAEEAGVEIWGFDSPEVAYVHLCRRHVEREYWAAPNTQIVLPRFEQFVETPVFHKYGHLPRPVAVRFFAAAHPKAVGIFTCAAYVAEFLDVYHGSAVKEFSSALDAQNWLNFQFLRYILPMSAYLGVPTPYYAEIPLDVIFEVGFAAWFQENCASVPSQLVFPQLPKGGEA